jgi:large subunit ribosomal protein L11
MIIKLLIDGGDMKPSAAISQKLGPLGINIGKVIQDVNKSTANFKGMRVPVELDVNPKTKDFSVHVSSPPTAELIKKEIGIDLASGASKKVKVGNLAIEQLINIAKTKSPNMTSGSLKSAVRSVVGSCLSLGVLIENKEAKEVEQEILEGKYDSEINSEKTEVSTEKRGELDKFFSQLKLKQEAILKKEEEEKKAEEEKAAAAKPAAQTTAQPAAGAEKKPAEAAAKPVAAKK